MRRPVAEQRRDAGLARLGHIQRWLVVGTVATTGLITAALAHALPGRAATPPVATTLTVPAVGSSPPTLTSPTSSGLQSPTVAPTTTQAPPQVTSGAS